MSHFTVLVHARSEGELEEKLLPYYEYGTSSELDRICIEKGYITWHDMTKDEWYISEYEEGSQSMFQHVATGGRISKYDDRFKRRKKDDDGPWPSYEYICPDGWIEVDVPFKETYPTIEAWLLDWEELKIKDGIVGRYRNDNAKWDWWQVGGRWADTIPLIMKNGKRPLSVIDGSPSLLFDNFEKQNDRTDSAYATDIDWEKWRSRRLGYFVDEWENTHKALNQVNEIDDPVQLYQLHVKSKKERFPAFKSPGLLTWLCDLVMDYLDYHRGKYIQEIFQTLQDYVRYRVSEDIRHTYDKDYFKHGTWDSLSEILNSTRDEYIELQRNRGLTHAFIDQDGQWYEKGEMGWWAIVTDDKPSYAQKFWQFVESLGPEDRVWMIDCHI